MSVMALPQLTGRPVVTDGGMETDLIFHHGVDLPLFAAFPLVDSPEGRSLLTAYYEEYAAIARRADAGPRAGRGAGGGLRRGRRRHLAGPAGLDRHRRGRVGGGAGAGGGLRGRGRRGGSTADHLAA